MSFLNESGRVEDTERIVSMNQRHRQVALHRRLMAQVSKGSCPQSPRLGNALQSDASPVTGQVSNTVQLAKYCWREVSVS